VSASAVLEPYVARIGYYDTDLGGPGVHRGLPSTTVTMVLPLDEPIEVSWHDGRSRRAAWSSVAGLHPEPAAIHHDGHQRGVMVDLTIAGARALLGMPAGELCGALLTLEEAAPRLARLPEQLAEAAPGIHRAVVERALVTELARRDAPGPRTEVARALALLTRGAGVRTTSDDVGFSRRRLTDLVRAECGLAPKAYQRIARFQAARRLIGRRDLGEVAAVCGYADQAHLTREWRRLAGCTPTTWIREEFPFVQDAARGGE